MFSLEEEDSDSDGKRCSEQDKEFLGKVLLLFTVTMLLFYITVIYRHIVFVLFPLLTIRQL